MIILHIGIAVTSIILTTIAYMRPSRSILRVAYSLIGGTLASGTYLVLATPSHLLSGCLMGLAYLGIVSIGITAAQRRLTVVTQTYR